jgi:hypothetical protein
MYANTTMTNIKGLLEAIEEDGNNAKRVQMYSDNGLLYNEICFLQKLQ